VTESQLSTIGKERNINSWSMEIGVLKKKRCGWIEDRRMLAALEHAKHSFRGLGDRYTISKASLFSSNEYMVLLRIEAARLVLSITRIMRICIECLL
jgi:hypothetical protein